MAIDLKKVSISAMVTDVMGDPQIADKLADRTEALTTLHDLEGPSVNEAKKDYAGHKEAILRTARPYGSDVSAYFSESLGEHYELSKADINVRSSEHPHDLAFQKMIAHALKYGRDGRVPGEHKTPILKDFRSINGRGPVSC